tara:strand:- start:2167 stop:2562 length:396 start_codon:yes stop_codon:yes gene_type:complete
MLVRVNVTQKDIDSGVCGAATLCAVANAICRLIDTSYLQERARGDVVLVDGHDVLFMYEDDSVMDRAGLFVSPLPFRVSHWISSFDEDRYSADPISFDLDIPEHLLLPQVTRPGNLISYDCPKALALQADK